VSVKELDIGGSMCYDEHERTLAVLTSADEIRDLVRPVIEQPRLAVKSTDCSGDFDCYVFADVFATADTVEVNSEVGSAASTSFDHARHLLSLEPLRTAPFCLESRTPFKQPADCLNEVLCA
jgi:hypothetical protein